MSLTEDVEAALKDEHGYEEVEGTTDTPVNLYQNLRVKKRDGDTGTLKETRQVRNTIVNDGATYLRDIVGSAPANSAMRWIGVGQSKGPGNGGFQSADSSLESEVARSQGQFNTVGGTVGKFTQITTFTGLGDQSVRESGLFNQDGVNQGTMLAGQTFAAVDLAAGDKLEVQWSIFFSQ